MRRRILAGLWAAALAVSLALAGTASAEEAVYQMVVNDRFLEINSSTMPFRSDGVLYIPYTIFDRSVTGVRLGTSSFVTRTDSEFILTIYGVGNTLRFDMLRGVCLDQSTGENTGMRAISRGGTYFVPVGVCSYFSLNVSLTPTSYGTLLRVTNGQQIYTIDKFIEVATDTGRLQERYNEYIRSQTAPAATPAPSTAAPAGASPTPTQTPADNEGPSRQDVPLYLAFQCTDGAGVDSILDVLERDGIRALFLFRPEDLAARDAQLRRIVGSGHAVGLLVPGGSGEETAAALEKGARLLERIARLRAHIALLEEPEEGAAELLNGLGWACWTDNVDGLPDGRSQTEQAAALLSAAEDQSGPVRITLDDSAVSAGVLSRILPQLREEGYQFRLAVETQL